MLAEMITDNPAGLHTSYIRSVGLAGAVVFFTLVILGEVSGLYSVSNFMALQSEMIRIINQTFRLEALLDTFIEESADFVNDFNDISSQPTHSAGERIILEYGYKTYLTFLNTYEVLISNIAHFMVQVQHITDSVRLFIPGEQVSLMDHIFERLQDLIWRAASAADTFRQLEEHIIHRNLSFTNEFGVYEEITRRASFCFENPNFLSDLGIEE